MGTRSNPFYRYQNPQLGMAFDGITAALFPQPDKSASEIELRQAQAAAYRAQEAERNEKTRGTRMKNDRYEQMPTGLAEAILSGFQFPAAPAADQGAMMPGDPTASGLQPQPVDNRPPAERLAAALQQAEAYGLDFRSMLQSSGLMQYMNQAMGDNPQDALPFAPFAGITSPNANTALTAEDQNRISARNADESLNQATTVEGMRNKNRIEIEGMREGGRAPRGTGSGGVSASSIPAVTPSTAKNMRDSLENRLKQMGYNNIEPQAVDEMLALSTRLFQDRDSEAFKNTALAVQEAVDMLEMGQVPGVSEVLRKRLFRDDARDLTRVPPSERGAASDLPDISTVPGIPAGSRYGNRTAQGIEILDRNGKLIGHGRLPE
jgi:hypothetical protein